MDEQVVDLAPFLAGIVKEAGGRLQVGLSTINGLDPDVEALAIEPSEDGEGLVLMLVSPADIPND